MAAGTFDILRAAHAGELKQVRSRSAAARLLVVVLPAPATTPLAPAGRAELVAALHVVDYVVTADAEDLERLSRAHASAEVVRLEAADGRRMRQLIEHVRRRQTA